MRKDFVIERHPTCGTENNDANQLIRTTFSFLPIYWRKVIPRDTRVMITGKNLCAIEECGKGFIAQFDGVKFDSMQVSLVGNIIYAHHNEDLKRSRRTFQGELLVMFAYAMCRNQSLLCLLEKYFPYTNNRHRKFANTFPAFLFAKGILIEQKKSILVSRMTKIEEGAKKIFQ